MKGSSVFVIMFKNGWHIEEISTAFISEDVNAIFHLHMYTYWQKEFTSIQAYNYR